MAQFEDSEVSAERVLQGTDRCAVVHGGAFVIRAGSQVELNDFLSFDFAGPRQHSHVIIGRDETTGGVQAESRAEIAFQSEAEILYFSDRTTVRSKSGVATAAAGDAGGNRSGASSLGKADRHRHEHRTKDGITLRKIIRRQRTPTSSL